MVALLKMANLSDHEKEMEIYNYMFNEEWEEFRHILIRLYTEENSQRTQATLIQISDHQRVKKNMALVDQDGDADMLYKLEAQCGIDEKVDFLYRQTHVKDDDNPVLKNQKERKRKRLLENMKHINKKLHAELEARCDEMDGDKQVKKVKMQSSRPSIVFRPEDIE